MAFWSLTTYTRPDTSKEFYIRHSVSELKSSSTIGTKIVEMETAGLITHYSISESADNLKQYVKIGFDSEFNELKIFKKNTSNIQNISFDTKEMIAKTLVKKISNELRANA